MGGPATIDGKAHPETDNFQPCQFQINGITYSSAENYFQWSKATNDQDRARVLKSGTGRTAWQAGQHIAIRGDWEEVKVQEMYNGNRAKFDQNAKEREALVQSGDSPILCRGSTDFWNVWNQIILERIRSELRQNGEKDRQIAEGHRSKMDQYAAQHRK